MPRTVPLALCAAREALADAGVDPESLSLDRRRRIGVEIGTGGGGLALLKNSTRTGLPTRPKSECVHDTRVDARRTLIRTVNGIRATRAFARDLDSCTSSTDAIFYGGTYSTRPSDMMIAGGVDATACAGHSSRV